MSQNNIWDGPRFDPANLKPEPVRNTGPISWWVDRVGKSFYICGKLKIDGRDIMNAQLVSSIEYGLANNSASFILHYCDAIERNLRRLVPNPDLMDAE